MSIYFADDTTKKASSGSYSPRSPFHNSFSLNQNIRFKTGPALTPGFEAEGTERLKVALTVETDPKQYLIRIQ